MNQVKYIAYACLIAIASAGAFSFLSLLSGSDPAPSSQTVNAAPSGDAMSTQDAATSSKGFSLFRANCASCHAVDKVLSGPALAGVTKRGPWAENEKNIVSWIRNPGAFIPTQTYTQELQKQ